MYRSLPSLSVDRLFLEHLGATRFVSYLSDAIFPPHAITELGAIGADANTIAIGDGLTQIAVEKYSAFLGRYVFPPKHLLGVRAVVADGNAKVLIKCGRGSTAPKRAGAPRKDRLGEKREAKHYWNGWISPLAQRLGGFYGHLPRTFLKITNLRLTSWRRRWGVTLT